MSIIFRLRTYLQLMRGVSLLAIGLLLLPAGALHAQPKGDVVIAMPQLSQQFDPTGMVGVFPHMVFDFIYDGLINLGPDGKYPALAESWQISNDGKQVDFKLRQGVNFQNGDPFTAEDVKFTFERVMAPDSIHLYRRGFQDAIERIEVIDPHTVRFILKQPWPPFFTTNRYALTPIVPKNYYERIGAKAFQEKPIGTGPFRLLDFKAGEWTKFGANEKYWAGSPKIKTATQRLVVEPFTRYAMLERGEADIVAGLTGALLDKIKGNPNVKMFASRYSGSSFILFNTDSFPEAADRRVRLAISYAINRKEIAEKIQGGVCQPATSMFSPGTFGYLSGLPQIPYDPAKAKALLKEAGIKPGHKVTFAVQTESFVGLPNAPAVLEAIAGNLEAIGLTVERKNVDNAAWLVMLRSHTSTGIFNIPLSLPDDGGEFINSYFVSWVGLSKGGNKPSEYSQYDDLFKAQAQAIDPSERTKILQKFAKLESENFEGVPVFWCDTPFAANAKRIKAWKPALGSGYHMNLKQLELAN